MYKHLLIATDGSDLAKKAVEQGLDLAKVLNAKATIVTVTERWMISAPDEVVAKFPVEEYEKAAAANASRILKDVRDAAARTGIVCETVHVKDQFPAEGIVDTAKARGCDLIVMASHGHRGMMQLVLGSQANRVVTQSTTPVLICR
jgi:nucleotide-binding universal stress UspA family protein